MREDQKVIFEIDNLGTKKIKKITIPIDKKKYLIISNNNENLLEYAELTKELRMGTTYKENFIKSSLYKSAIEKKIDQNIVVKFAQIY